MPIDKQLPAYKSHKTVWALKIRAITPTPGGDGFTITPNDIGYGPFSVTNDYFIKHNPQPGGYWVQYEDGYQSYSPAKAFEEGYAALKEPSPGTDQQIESEIHAKGLTAPRITPADIEANIASIWYINAGEAIVIDDYHPPVGSNNPLRLLTFCVLVLRNGFTVTGESACASPENFDAEIGRKVAYENAKQKIWPLLGYQLREQLYQATQPAHHPV